MSNYSYNVDMSERARARARERESERSPELNFYSKNCKFLFYIFCYRLWVRFWILPPFLAYLEKSDNVKNSPDPLKCIAPEFSLEFLKEKKKLETYFRNLFRRTRNWQVPRNLPKVGQTRIILRLRFLPMTTFATGLG